MKKQMACSSVCIIEICGKIDPVTVISLTNKNMDPLKQDDDLGSAAGATPVDETEETADEGVEMIDEAEGEVADEIE